MPASRASINISDPAFLHGAAVFTTMLARNKVVFRFDQHLERLSENVRFLGLDTEVSTGALVSDTYTTIEANGLSDARCRITLSPGPPDGRPLVLITADPLPEYPEWWYSNGISTVVTSLKQSREDPIAGRKTSCYLPRILAMREAAAKKADEAVWYTTDNHLAEACFSNIFLWLDGKVKTPPKDTPVLPGITRQAVLELCDELDIPSDEESRLTVDDMLAAEEVFLTNSTMGIRPVARIERHEVGNGKPGETTKKLADALVKLIRKECSRDRSDTGTEPRTKGK